MTIKGTYQSEAEIPVEYRSLYEQRGDAWELQAEGVKPQSAFDAVQRALDSERQRVKEIEAQARKWAPLSKHDPAHIQAMLDQLPELEALRKQSTDANARAEEIANARITAKLLPIERERDALRQQYAEAEQRLQQMTAAEQRRQIADAVRAAGSKAGLDPDSVDDAIMFAERVLEVAADGVVQVREGAGIPAGIDAERMLAHIRDAGMRPRWWAENVSGGLRGGKGVTTVANPWAKETFNLTEQANLERTNPAMAERLRNAAK